MNGQRANIALSHSLLILTKQCTGSILAISTNLQKLRGHITSCQSFSCHFTITVGEYTKTLYYPLLLTYYVSTYAMADPFDAKIGRSMSEGAFDSAINEYREGDVESDDDMDDGDDDE